LGEDIIGDLTIEEYDAIVNFIKDNNIFIRSGSCNRCGMCCSSIYDKHPDLGGVKIPCSHLSFDGKGLATCDIHEGVRPQICIDNPIYPTACMVPEAIESCGYSWKVNSELKKEDALKMFDRICSLCYRPCTWKDEVIKEINEVCK